MKKVASYLTLGNVDRNMFYNWMKTLPVNITERNAYFLWKKCKGRKAIIWMSFGGFKFFD